jgi:hypothetical protein
MTTPLFTWAAVAFAASQKPDFECILVPSEIADLAPRSTARRLRSGRRRPRASSRN